MTDKTLDPTPTAGMPSDEMMSKWWPGTKDGIPVESTVITKYVFERILAGLEAAVLAQRPKMTDEDVNIFVADFTKKNARLTAWDSGTMQAIGRIVCYAFRDFYEKGETK